MEFGGEAAISPKSTRTDWRSQHGLVIAYQPDGQIDKGIELLEHVVAVEAKVLRDDHPSRLVLQSTLVVLYAELTTSDEALT